MDPEVVVVGDAVVLETPRDRVGLIRLNVPSKSNAQTLEVVDRFPRILEELHDRADLRVVVLTGTGKNFCSGADFSTLQELEERSGLPSSSTFSYREGLRRFYDSFLKLLEIPQPTLAAINGAAVGGGLALALMCDMRIMDEEGKIGGNFPKLGIHPAVGASHFLPQCVGFQQAMKMSLLGEFLSGREAAETGLVMEAVPPDEVRDRTLELAASIAGNAPLSLREITNTYRTLKTRRLGDTLNQELLALSMLFKTEDAEEGIRAMLDDRDPDFKGR